MTEAAETPSDRRTVVAGAIGNVLEWYDYSLYAFFAAIIGRQFFPDSNELDSLIAVFGVFAAGYLMRPIGALVFGYIGDTYGRKPTLVLSAAAMAIPTFAIGPYGHTRTIWQGRSFPGLPAPQVEQQAVGQKHFFAVSCEIGPARFLVYRPETLTEGQFFRAPNFHPMPIDQDGPAHRAVEMQRCAAARVHLRNVQQCQRVAVERGDMSPVLSDGPSRDQ